MSAKQVIGGPLEIDGRVLSLSQAIRAGDFVFVTGQVPMRDGKPMTDGGIEAQTRACLNGLSEILAECRQIDGLVEKARGFSRFQLGLRGILSE
jgi:enamine deaminase RidA (YjgF/YER057c/UK114 family)